MIRLFLNGLAASAGGGLTYLRNVVPQLSARDDVHTTVSLGPQLRDELQGLPNISILETLPPSGLAGRFWHEQEVLPRLIRESRADALVSAGNFALRKSPVPQILLSRNSLYLSSDFFRDLRTRHAYRLWLDTHIKSILAKRSILWADRTVAPSRAFAEELKSWTESNISSIHHGFDAKQFFGNQAPLSPDVEQKLNPAAGTLRLLFVSHYNYYRNFETLFRAIPFLQASLGGRKVKVFLTCTLQPDATPGGYDPRPAVDLIRRLGIAENIVELGTIAYPQLHRVFQASDIYVTPAYAETFAHPLVEAMASGLPIVASDLPVHREICGAAALYFPRFSASELAEQVLRIADSQELGRVLAVQGKLRSQDFSWKRHVDQIMELASSLVLSRTALDSNGQLKTDATNAVH